MARSDGGRLGSRCRGGGRALAVAAATLAGCVASSRPGPEVPTRPSVAVLVRGEAVDLVGVEVGRDRTGAHVLVRTNDGRELWVADEAVSAEDLAAGDRVALRLGEGPALTPAVLGERAGDVLAVTPLGEDGGPAGAATLVSVAVVVARLRGGAAVLPERRPVAAAEPDREVAWAAGEVWALGWVVGCEGGRASVLFRDGETAAVPAADLADVRVGAGEAVAAHYDSGRLTYEGVVVAVEDGGLRVRYYDGDVETVGLDDLAYVVRPQLDGAAEPGAGAAVCQAPPTEGLRRPVLVRRWTLFEAGTLLGCAEAGSALVRGRDGAPRAAPLASLVPLSPLAAGRLGRTPCRGSGRFLAALSAAAPGSLTAAFEDGDGDTVPLDAVLSVLLPREDQAPPPLEGCPVTQP